MNSPITRRATSVSIASSSGSSNSGVPSAAATAVTGASAGTRSARGPGRPARRRGRPRRGRRPSSPRPSPARSATIRVSSRTWSSGRSSRRSGSDRRSRRRSARGTSTMNRPSSKSGALNSGWPLGAMTSEPPQNEIDSSTPTRLQKTTIEVVSWAYVRMSVRHDVAVPSPTSFVAARSRPGRRRHVDQDLGAVEGEQLGHGQVPEVLADRDPDADPEPRRRRPQEIARGEEPPLVEQAVRRQEQLPVDVPDPAVLEQGRGDEQAVVGRFLDERDDDRQAVASRRPARPGADRRAGSRPPPRGPGGGSRSGRAPGRRRARRRRPRASSISSWWRARFASSIAEPRRDLGQGDRQRLHAPEHSRSRARAPRARDARATVARPASLAPRLHARHCRERRAAVVPTCASKAWQPAVHAC